jgi:hypothetical protein
MYEADLIVSMVSFISSSMDISRKHCCGLKRHLLSKYSEYLDILITKHNKITVSIIFVTIITCN